MISITIGSQYSSCVLFSMITIITVC